METRINLSDISGLIDNVVGLANEVQAFKHKAV